MMTATDVVVVGGGAVGCAIARAIARHVRFPKQVVVVEKNNSCGMETSSRSSEVVHAGLYYPQGSYKAKFCIRGRDLLLQHMTNHAIPFNMCGKLVVAGPAEQDSKNLRQLLKKGFANGLSRLELLTESQASKLEPEVNCSAAIFSPYSGIFDSHGVLESYQVDIVEAGNGSTIVTDCMFESASIQPQGCWKVVTDRGDIFAKTLVNAAGLHAHRVATLIDSPSREMPAPYFAKGHYVKLQRRSGVGAPFKHLVYPLPNDAGLGIHATLDLRGEVRFGPDVQWLPYSSAASEEVILDYSVSDEEKLLRVFTHEVSKYWPAVADRDKYSLQVDYTGIRPKLVGPGSPAADFLIQRHELSGATAVHLLGIESPGWTASMGIAEHVTQMLCGNT